MTTDQSWLEHYAYIAVWLEAVALIAIFFWDRVDARRDLEVARNTERAWLLTDLVWPSGEIGRVFLGTNKQGEEVSETTTFFLVLKCRNAGKVPAWIDKVQGYVELVEGKLNDLSPPEVHGKREFAIFGPVAPGESESSNVAFTCQGHLRNDQLASIFMLVEYRDAFKKGRVTTCGYKVSGKYLERLVQFPERNYHK